MAASAPDGSANSVEIVCEPGVRVEWVLDVTKFTAAEPDPAPSRSLVATMLEIEQAIASCIDDLVAGVARVVYSFGGRDIHLRDGSRIEFRWELVVIDWRCLDCGIDTDAIDEYYMLRDEVWREANPDINGHLCIGCVEQRLARTLSAPDFSDRRVNTSTTIRRSARLIDRLGSGQAEAARDALRAQD